MIKAPRSNIRIKPKIYPTVRRPEWHRISVLGIAIVISSPATLVAGV
jgi:uncharacterized membrane protein